MKCRLLGDDLGFWFKSLLLRLMHFVLATCYFDVIEDNSTKHLNTNKETLDFANSQKREKGEKEH